MNKDLSILLAGIKSNFIGIFTKQNYETGPPITRAIHDSKYKSNKEADKAVKAAAKIQAERSEELQVERKELTKRLLRQRGIIPPK